MSYKRLIIPLLILVTVLAFWRASHGQFVYVDDDQYVFGNPYVLGGLGVRNVAWAFTTDATGYSHPLTWLSLMLDSNLFGTGPRGYHTTNILLHTLAVVLLYLALNFMTAAPWRSGLVALLFAIHPLRVESVAWISERKDVLSGCLAMATLLAYALHACRPSWWRYGITMLLFAMGLLAKPMLVTLPILLLLLDVWPLRRLSGLSLPAPSPRAPICPPRSATQLIVEKIPLLLLSAASCAVTYRAQVQYGAVKTLTELSLTARLANVPVSYVRYLFKMVWFGGLTPLYPITIWSIWQVAGATFLLLAISAVALRRFLANPWLAIGWFWFLGMLAPVIGFLQSGGQAMADRYSYFPTIGLLIMCVWSLPERVVQIKPGRWAVGVATLTVVAVLSRFTWVQSGYWHDSETLFNHAIKCTPGNSMLLVDFGLCLDHIDHKPAEAIPYLRKAVEVDPQYGLAQFDLGITLSELSLENPQYFSEALYHLNLACKLRPHRPEPHNAIGIAYFRQGLFDQALAEFQKAVLIDPNFFRSYIFMGNIFASRGQLDNALEQYKRALRLDPEDATLYSLVGLRLMDAGRAKEAIPYFVRAVQLEPGVPQYRAILARAQEGAPYADSMSAPSGAWSQSPSGQHP